MEASKIIIGIVVFIIIFLIVSYLVQIGWNQGLVKGIPNLKTISFTSALALTILLSIIGSMFVAPNFVVVDDGDVTGSGIKLDKSMM